ncbi:SAM-dependent methyltransferase [Endozoicomonas sp.]|uniref:SAM-dependent methyltransferase n=1 Tax=Endozoicomonas sp. TaxID=1892382 RepID=UPI003AF49BB4
MKLENVVPWGRSFEEYREMFSLSEDDLKKFILGCGDGPASFNAEHSSQGGSVVSIDPAYKFTAQELQSRIAEVYDEIMPQMQANKDKYLWESIPSVEALGNIRMSAMEKFIADYEKGKEEERYIEASLPTVSFSDKQFDLALCSHYLFLYSEHISLNEHIQSLIELSRVAKEVRVYPLLSLDGKISTHLQAAMSALGDLGLSTSLANVGYQFQKGATQMLVVKSV